MRAAGVRVGLLTIVLLAGAAPVAAQPDLRELALGWALGEYAAPLICQLGAESDQAPGDPKRGLRRLLVEPARGQRPPANRLRLYDLDLPKGSRCHDDMGKAQLNAIGSVMFSLDGHHRPDIADRDFAEALQREGGFEFPVRSGVLGIGEPGTPRDGLRRVDFRGGTLSMHQVARGSDADRRMGDFRGGRRLLLALRAKDGTELTFDLVMIGP